jgi:hypothetical protein
VVEQVGGSEDRAVMRGAEELSHHRRGERRRREEGRAEEDREKVKLPGVAD